jgi:hypothetical protein
MPGQMSPGADRHIAGDDQSPTDERTHQMSNPRTSQAVARQREDSLHKANHVRHQRRLLRERIARLAPPDGAALAARVLTHPPGHALGMSVERLLTAISSFGPVHASEVAGAASLTALGRLTGHERAEIASACQRRAAHLRGRRAIAPAPRREQALQALADADRVRLARAQALRLIAQAPTTVTGAWRAAALIRNSNRPQELDGLTIKAVLTAIPDVGGTCAQAVMEPLALSDRTRLAMLSPSRATRVAAAVIGRYGRHRRHTSPLASAPATVPTLGPLSSAA